MKNKLFIQNIAKSLILCFLVIVFLIPCSANAENISEDEPDFQIYQSEFLCSNEKYINYTLRVPNDFTENMPLIVWLHGGGECGNNAVLKDFGLIKAANELDENRFIILEPSSPGDWISFDRFEMVCELIDAVVSNFHVDDTRIILTGHSLGGQGTWAYGAMNPNMWAAIVPVSNEPTTDIDGLINADVPVWAMAGEWDGNGTRNGMPEAIELLKESGTHKEAKYTEVPGAAHFQTSYVPYTTEFFDWAEEQVNENEITWRNNIPKEYCDICEQELTHLNLDLDNDVYGAFEFTSNNDLEFSIGFDKICNKCAKKIEAIDSSKLQSILKSFIRFSSPIN